MFKQLNYYWNLRLKYLLLQGSNESLKIKKYNIKKVGDQQENLKILPLESLYEETVPQTESISNIFKRRFLNI